jgi:hypothetical protein
MASRVERLLVAGALLALGSGLAAPGGAEARVAAQASEASCSSFGQALLARAYGASPWQVAPVEQVASTAFKQAITSEALQTLFNQYDGELGALQQQQEPAASLSTGSVGGSPATICTYQANGVFQRGTATVGLILMEAGGDWQVVRVRLHDVEHGSA